MKKVTVAVPSGGKLFFEVLTAERADVSADSIVLEGVSHIVGPMGDLPRPARVVMTRSCVAFVVIEEVPEEKAEG